MKNTHKRKVEGRQDVFGVNLWRRNGTERKLEGNFSPVCLLLESR